MTMLHPVTINVETTDGDVVTLLSCSDCSAVVIPDAELANWHEHEAYHARLERILADQQAIVKGITGADQRV